jgi:hypothetical protein
MGGSVTFGWIHLPSLLFSMNFILFFEHQCGSVADIFAAVGILARGGASNMARFGGRHT